MTRLSAFVNQVAEIERFVFQNQAASEGVVRAKFAVDAFNHLELFIAFVIYMQTTIGVPHDAEFGADFQGGAAEIVVENEVALRFAVMRIAAAIAIPIGVAQCLRQDVECVQARLSHILFTQISPKTFQRHRADVAVGAFSYTNSQIIEILGSMHVSADGVFDGLFYFLVIKCSFLHLLLSIKESANLVKM